MSARSGSAAGRSVWWTRMAPVGYAAELTPEQQARQREALGKHIADADAVHLLRARAGPARADPADARRRSRPMRPGSLVVDLAADQGGNRALTKPGETVDHGGRAACSRR